jgi:hypothetical protein
MQWFVFKNLQQRVVQLELHLERAIRHTSATLKHRQCLFQDLVEGHGSLSHSIDSCLGSLVEARVCLALAP